MKVYNHSTDQTSYTSTQGPALKSSATPDFRSRIQNQESPTPCCLGSCLIKIKDLFVALFSWLFCCKSAISKEDAKLAEDTAKERLKTVVTDWQDRKLIVFMETTLTNLEKLNLAWQRLKRGGEEEAGDEIDQINSQHPEYADLLLEQTIADCRYYLEIMSLAQKITQESYTLKTLNKRELSVEWSFEQRVWVKSKIEQCKDSDKSDLEKILIAAVSLFTGDDFKRFLGRLGIQPS